MSHVGLDDVSIRDIVSLHGFHGDDPLDAYASIKPEELESWIAEVSPGTLVLTFGQKAKLRLAHKICCTVAQINHEVTPMTYHIHQAAPPTPPQASQAGTAAAADPKLNPTLVKLSSYISQVQEGAVPAIEKEVHRMGTRTYRERGGQADDRGTAYDRTGHSILGLDTYPRQDLRRPRCLGAIR